MLRARDSRVVDIKLCVSVNRRDVRNIRAIAPSGIKANRFPKPNTAHCWRPELGFGKAQDRSPNGAYGGLKSSVFVNWQEAAVHSYEYRYEAGWMSLADSHVSPVSLGVEKESLLCDQRRKNAKIEVHVDEHKDLLPGVEVSS